MTAIWATAHLAAMSGPDPSFQLTPQPLDLSGQTVRQAVRLRRGGTAIRLMLSNEYGDTSLVLDEVTVGDHVGGLRVPVLLGGQPTWEIAAGDTVTSDPAPLATKAGDELLINWFCPGLAPGATYLHAAQRTGKAAPGNQVAEPELTGASRFGSLYLLARVLVDSPAAGPVIVALGDSITRGDMTTVDRDQRYPDHLQRRLLGAGMDGAAVLNAGLGANRVLRAGLGPSMLDRLERDVLSIPDATHVIIMGGANDIGLPIMHGEVPPSGRELTEGLFTLARRARARGVQPVLGTTTPFSLSDERVRGAVNDAARSQRDWPVADFAAAVADPDDPARLAPAFDSGDGVHPSDEGARALAEAIDLALFA